MNFLVTAAIVVASFQVTAVGPHLRDPIGWNSNGFVLSNYGEVYPSQKGDEIIIRRAESSFLMMRLLQKVFVFIHKPSESENITNLVFSYVPGQLDETEPRVIWKTATSVSIQLALSQSINVDVQKRRLGVIQINYDIHYACYGNDETQVLSNRGDVALVRTTSCSRKDGSTYYVRAVVIEKADARSGLRVQAFQYEPTDRGLEFDSPVLRWDNRDTLKIALPKRSILRTILQESSVKGIRITYDFR